MSYELRPNRLPSRYNAVSNVPLVVEPSTVGLKMNTSSLAPEMPVTEKLPMVDR